MLLCFHAHGLVPVAVEKWFRLVGVRDQMGGAQASMLGRRDGVRSDMK